MADSTQRVIRGCKVHKSIPPPRAINYRYCFKNAVLSALTVACIVISQERFYFGDSVLPLFESGIPLLLEKLRQLPDHDKVGGICHSKKRFRRKSEGAMKRRAMYSISSALAARAEQPSCRMF